MSEIPIISTPITMAIHPNGTNPIFGQSVIHLSIDDEAAGAFVVLREIGSTGEVRISLEELETAARVAAEMLKNYRD